MGRRVIQRKFAYVSEEYTAPIFRVEKKQAAKRTHIDQKHLVEIRAWKNSKRQPVGTRKMVEEPVLVLAEVRLWDQTTRRHIP
jgi:hypothetical protein